MHIPFFHQNNSPLDQAKLDQEGNPVESGEVKPSNSKKFIILGAIGVLLILIGILLFIPTQNLPFVQKPTPTPIPDKLLATVGAQPIYLSQIQLLAYQQYLPKAVNKKVLTLFLNTAIERAILDQEAKKQSITVSEEEAKSSLNNQVNKKISPVLVTQAKYALLKEKIMTTFIKSVNAYTIGYWIPPFSNPQLPLFAQQRTQGKIALQEAKSSIDKGEDPLAVARTIYAKYPTLQNILSFNGGFVKYINDSTITLPPRTYTMGQTDYSEALFSTPPKTTRIVDNKNGAGSVLLDVISVNAGDYPSYEDWLIKQKFKLVKVVAPI